MHINVASCARHQLDLASRNKEYSGWGNFVGEKLHGWMDGWMDAISYDIAWLV